jgi:multiple sugar transport system permease protein
MTSAAQAVGVQRRARRRRDARERAEAVAFMGFISPWFIGFVLVGALPLFASLAMSLTTFDLYGLSKVHWVGLKNYREALDNPETVTALENSAIFVAIVVPLGVIVQIALAILLNTRARFIGLFRAIFFVPAVLPVVAGVLIWKEVVAGDEGILTKLVRVFEPGTFHFWLDDHARAMLIMFMIWSTAGLGMMVFLAGLQEISAELREAAALDGATGRQILRTITIPLLTPVIFLQVVLGVIGAMQVVIQPILLAPREFDLFTALPREDVTLLPTNVFRTTFVGFDIRHGAALAWLVFLIVLALTVVLFRTARYWVFYGGDR